jgi:hypothetical protein
MQKTFTLYALILMLILGIKSVYAKENASNPLASTSHMDLQWKYKDLDGPERNDFSLDGTVVLNPKLNLKYELHYWDTDESGSSKNNWESLHLKPIYLPTKGNWGAWKYKLGIGAEWIVGLGNEDEGIGSGSDQVGSGVGLELKRGNTVLTQLLEHFVEYDGPDVNKTIFHLIAFQSLPNDYWGKLDSKITVDWEDDQTIPASLKLELGKNFSPCFGAYVDALVGIGDHRSYDWGLGVGVRFNY